MASAAVSSAPNGGGVSSSNSLLIDGVDIDTCTDDYKLNEMLDNCNDYESRRRIRARIKVLLTTQQADSIKEGPTGSGKTAAMVNSPRSNLGSSKTEVTTRQQSTYRSSFQQPNKTTNQSAFSKFQQLDQQQVKSTPRTVGGGGTGNVLLARSASGIKDFLLQWCQTRTSKYQNIQIENFSSSWNDGLAFCALIHNFYPDAFDYSKLEAKNKTYNFTLAFKTAEERAGIAPLLDVEDMVMMSRPDWKCVFTYVQSFYRRFKDE